MGVLLLLLGLTACGGRSVAHVEGEAGRDETDQTSTLEGCAALCEECGIAKVAGAASCDTFCANLDHDAVAAECGTVLDDFIRCRTKSTNACSLGDCPNETNDLTVCVLTYCDDFSLSAPELCSAW